VFIRVKCIPVVRTAEACEALLGWKYAAWLGWLTAELGHQFLYGPRFCHCLGFLCCCTTLCNFTHPYFFPLIV
jgi:hypothetical protein